MKENISDFAKTKDFLVCVDSDGCAMDTMDVKHEKCFGPKAVEVWGLQNVNDRFHKNHHHCRNRPFNEVNLYKEQQSIRKEPTKKRLLM